MFMACLDFFVPTAYLHSLRALSSVLSGSEKECFHSAFISLHSGKVILVSHHTFHELGTEWNRGTVKIINISIYNFSLVAVFPILKRRNRARLSFNFSPPPLYLSFCNAPAWRSIEPRCLLIARRTAGPRERRSLSIEEGAHDEKF